jgi:FAD/FMN-containing dehydrogenase
MVLFESLRQSVSGIVISREGFTDAIVGATSAEDVQAAVRFARENGLKFTLLENGHRWSDATFQEGIVVVMAA